MSVSLATWTETEMGVQQNISELSTQTAENHSEAKARQMVTRIFPWLHFSHTSALICGTRVRSGLRCARQAPFVTRRTVFPVRVPRHRPHPRTTVPPFAAIAVAGWPPHVPAGWSRHPRGPASVYWWCATRAAAGGRAAAIAGRGLVGLHCRCVCGLSLPPPLIPLNVGSASLPPHPRPPCRARAPACPWCRRA